MSVDDLKNMPPWIWLALAGLAGAAVLAYNRFAHDNTDPDWTAPKEVQPPIRAPYSPVPCAPAGERPMAVQPAFRARGYAASLVDADFSIIGEF